MSDRSSPGGGVFETTLRDEVLAVTREGTRWLSTGADGGYSTGPVAYNVSVPSGWGRTDLQQYVEQRRERAGFEREGPALLTGVSMEHARVARAGPAAVLATAGISNPATFEREGADGAPNSGDSGAGTVNVVACVERDLPAGAHANLIAVVAEAKTAALVAETGFPGTTTDAVIVGCDPDAAAAEFSGSATPVGDATRACVYDAVRASLGSRYADQSPPESVEAAEYGVVTDRETRVSAPARKGQTD